MLLKSSTLYSAIDKAKREKYVCEVNRWLILIAGSTGVFRSMIWNLTERNAYLVTAPYHEQVHVLNTYNQLSHPISCHFVKQPFAPKFKFLYFHNPKAEEFKWLTAKFLDHGLFESWKGWQAQQISLIHRRGEKRMRRSSNFIATEVLGINNFIGQVHLFQVYILISVLTGICIVVFLLECAIQNAPRLSVFTLQKCRHFRKNLGCTVVRCIFFVARAIIGRLRQTLKYID
jgi:hypothetical protein